MGIGTNMACARLPTGFVDEWAQCFSFTWKSFTWSMVIVHIHPSQAPADQGRVRDAVPGRGQGLHHHGRHYQFWHKVVLKTSSTLKTFLISTVSNLPVIVPSATEWSDCSRFYRLWFKASGETDALWWGHHWGLRFLTHEEWIWSSNSDVCYVNIEQHVEKIPTFSRFCCCWKKSFSRSWQYLVQQTLMHWQRIWWQRQWRVALISQLTHSSSTSPSNS